MNGERLSRREFITSAVLATASALAVKELLLSGDAKGSEFDRPPTAEEADVPGEFDPQVFIRETASEGVGHHHETATTEVELDEVGIARLEGPVFTLVHTVSEGENLTMLARRYYQPEIFESGLAIEALLASNPGLAANPDLLKKDLALFIPIAEPVIVEPSGDKPLEVAASKYGFSIRSLIALNGNQQKYNHIYLPIHANPTLRGNEKLIVMPQGAQSYYGIAKENNYDLAKLLGRNRPDASRLENGHLIIVSDDNDTPEVPPATSDEVPATPPRRQTTTTTTPESRDGGASGEALISQRTWSEVIDGSLESAMLEQAITIEKLNNIELTVDGYRNFVASINIEYAGVFEEAGTTHPAGIIENPEYFILHHTAYGYKEGTAGTQQFIQSMINNRLAIQWLIDREGNTYQLVRDPRYASNHARGLNEKSTGVEVMTDSTKAQGSLTNQQLAAMLYLALYVHAEVYEKSSEEIEDVVVGHRDINDRLSRPGETFGTAGKPDFFTDVMEVIWPKLKKLAEEI